MPPAPDVLKMRIEKTDSKNLKNRKANHRKKQTLKTEDWGYVMMVTRYVMFVYG